MGPDFKVIRQKSGSSKPKIVVSRTIAKKAVDRNRIRRIIKEAQRQLGVNDFTIIVKQNFASLKTQEVVDKLKNAIKDAH